MSSYKAQLNAALKQRGEGPLGAAHFISSGPTEGISLLKVGGTLLIVIFIILIVLLIVHYTIRPVFKVKPNGKGFIPVPGIGKADDGDVYWTKLPHGDLLEADTIFGGPSASTDPGQSSKVNYSLCADLYFNDLNSGVNTNNNNRKVFCRYNHQSSTNTGAGLDYSILMELASDRNDLIVQVRTTANTETAVLKNILPKTPTRIGIIVGEKYFEVYRDGKLVHTRVLVNEPSSHIGTFWGDPGGQPTIYAGSTVTRTPSDENLFVDNPQSQQTSCPAAPSGPLGVVYNLHLWRRVISPEEMRDAMPRLLSSDDYNKDNVSAAGLLLYFKQLNQGIQRYGDTIGTTLDDWGGRVGAAANALAGGTP